MQIPSTYSSRSLATERSGGTSSEEFTARYRRVQLPALREYVTHTESAASRRGPLEGSETIPQSRVDGKSACRRLAELDGYTTYKVDKCGIGVCDPLGAFPDATPGPPPLSAAFVLAFTGYSRR